MVGSDNGWSTAQAIVPRAQNLAIFFVFHAFCPTLLMASIILRMI